MTRMNPGKRGYYKLVWEKLSLEELFEYKLERVFTTPEHEKKDTIGEGITFKKYIDYMFNQISAKI